MPIAISVVDTFEARCEIYVIKFDCALNKVQGMEHFLQTSAAQFKQ